MLQTLGASSEQTLEHPVRGGRSLTTLERQSVDLSGTIRGWGSDLDWSVRPGVPRDKAPQIGVERLYPPIEPQTPPFKIHKSTEHGRLTPVFGTSCPPHGLSGALRDAAYRQSEGKLSRWLTLVLADRVDVVEDLFADLSRGRLPNLYREMGLGAELRLNPLRFAMRVAIIGACAAGLVGYLRKR